MTGVALEIDTATGQAVSIEPISIVDHDIHLDSHDEFAEKRY
jgi:hypothetical protein